MSVSSLVSCPLWCCLDLTTCHSGVKLPGSEKCQKCSETGKSCLQTFKHCFRPVTSVRLKAADGRTTKQDLKYDAWQVWVNIPPTVSFVSPDFSSGIPDEPDFESEHPPSDSPFRRDDGEAFTAESSYAAQVVTTTSPQQEEVHHAGVSSGFQQMSENPHFPHHSNISIDSFVVTPSQSTGQGGIHQSPSSALITAASPAFSIRPSWPFENADEARLFHHYIIHVAPWIDVCDPQCHFGKEVPKRVGHYPVIANAIFAVASRRISLLSGKDDTQSPRYVSRCLPILIATLEDPLGHWDENLLAAVILLRTHEEMSDVDEKHHLFGTTRLLNSIASFAADGGLRESASWISLRQHIYISLTLQQALDINLTNYRDSGAFSEGDDESWANRIIFIFASILIHVFRPENELYAVRWAELEAEVEAWSLSKPWNFSPLWIEKSAVDKEGLPWPELLMTYPAQVVGMQYYCLSRILLSIYDPRLTKLGFGSNRLRKASEMVVLENLRMVVGLAVSNENVGNAMFQGSHILSACGSYLHNPKEQDAAVDFLKQMQQRMGWRTSHIINYLREQWQI